MSILANTMDPGNTFPANSSINEQGKIRITGFDLAHIIELSPLPKKITRVLKFACNLAGSTSEFMITKSLRNLAEDAGCSISTIQRVYGAAVKLGILSREEQRDQKNTNVSLPSKYTFTSKALAFVSASLNALKEAKVKPSGRQSIVRRIVSNAFFANDFFHATPGQNEQAPPGQNDYQELRDLPSKREIQNGEPSNSDVKDFAERQPAPVRKFGIYQDTQKQLAAAASAAQNERKQEAFEKRGAMLHEAIRVITSGFGKKQAAGNRKPKSRRQNDSFSGNFDNMDYSVIPEGFRSC